MKVQITLEGEAESVGREAMLVSKLDAAWPSLSKEMQERLVVAVEMLVLMGRHASSEVSPASGLDLAEPDAPCTP